MINFLPSGSLGDRLSQYCFSRTIASNFKYKLAATPIRGFPCTYNAVSGQEILSPLSSWQGQWPFDANSSRKIERAELFYPPGERLTLSGLFQRFEFISPNRDEIRDHWLLPDDSFSPQSTDAFLICLTDYGSQKSNYDNSSCLKLEDIWHLKRTVPHKTLHLLSETSNHPFYDTSPSLEADIFIGGPLEQLLFIRSFSKIAISQSTLQWWGAFLSNASEIYYPKCEGGLWSHPEPAKQIHDPEYYGIDLRVDEMRYIYSW